MSRASDLKATTALVALESIPPSLRETLASDPRMRENYGIRSDTVLEVGSSDFEAPISAIVSAVTDALSDHSEATLRDTGGNDWSVEPDTDRDHPTLFFVRGERRVGMHGWLTLSPDRDTRLRCLEALATDAGLPPGTCTAWRHVLEQRSLGGEEVADFLTDLQHTPHVQEQFLADSIRTSKLESQLVAPSSRTYFETLVGACGDSQSIRQHAVAGARDRLAELAAWRPYEGFLHGLYMASHAEVSAHIQVDSMSAEELVRAFRFLIRSGDRVSQIGAIEVGLRISTDRPEVNAPLAELVDLVLSDDATGEQNGFREYATLYVSVSSELSRRQQLAGKPPFYRRLAALAHAGVIQRQMASAGITLRDSALDSMTEEYLVRSFVDLRLEPRRHHTLASRERLRSHFLRRVLQAAGRHENEIHANLTEELGHLLGHEGFRQAGEAFILCAPGPLEESEENRALPTEFSKAIQIQLGENNAVAPTDFNALLTSATSFRIDREQADLAATALARSDNRLANVRSRFELCDTLAGLARAAAIARSEQLADTLCNVVRRYRWDEAPPITLDEAMQILLVAAASRAELGSWADFVGDCLTEWAFGELADDEGQMLHGYLRRFCEMVPELWATCGSADAALMAYNGRLQGSSGSESEAGG